MQQLIAYLENSGVVMAVNEEVTGFENTGGKISKVRTSRTAHETDAVVVASGSWSRELAQKMKVHIPLVPGRGYSVTLEDSPYKINHPAVLVEGRVALTPMDGNKIRFGGTMEITSTRTPPRMNRVQGILQAVEKYFPQFKIPMPSADKVWYGYRPCSADGLPYIGRVKQWNNVVMATGHAMLGLSLGPATGKLVSEVLDERPPSIDMAPFDPSRFD
jgi:D-amino-acid dehydrogenase